MPNIPVVFAVTSGGGSTSPVQVETDAQGQARTTWTLGGAGAQTASATVSGVVSGRRVQVSVSFTATATAETPSTVGDPGSVTTLTSTGATSQSATLRWTAASDGEGGGAKYAIRYGSPSISWSAAYATERTVAAVSPGQPVTYTYTGLTPSTNHQFQVVSYRGTLNVDAEFGGVSNIASVATTASTITPPPTPGSITVSPGSAVLQSPDDTIRLQAVARNADGSVITSPGIAWTSLNPGIATVSQVGTVRGVATGRARIIAAASCCVSDTVVVDVGSAIEPPPPSGSGTYPNMPTGLTLIGANNGSVKQAADGSAFGIAAFGSWSLTNHVDVVADASNPAGSGRSLRFRWDPQDREGGKATAGSFTGGPYRELYIMTRIYFEQGGWDFGHKFFYVGNAHRTSGGPTQYYADRPGGGFPQSLRMINQGGGTNIVVSSSSAAPIGTSTRPLVAGRWLNIEYRFVGETSAGAGNGQMYIWVNNVLVGHNRSVSWTTAFNGMEWYAHANSVPTESFYRLGELYIAGRR